MITNDNHPLHRSQPLFGDAIGHVFLGRPRPTVSMLHIRCGHSGDTVALLDAAEVHQLDSSHDFVASLKAEDQGRKSWEHDANIMRKSWEGCF